MMRKNYIILINIITKDHIYKTIESLIGSLAVKVSPMKWEVAGSTPAAGRSLIQDLKNCYFRSCLMVVNALPFKG